MQNGSVFKSKVGFMATEEPRDMLSALMPFYKLSIVPDTLTDKRFANNPFNDGEANIRFMLVHL